MFRYYGGLPLKERRVRARVLVIKMTIVCHQIGRFMRESSKRGVLPGGSMYLFFDRAGKLALLVWLAYAAYSAVHL